MTEMMLKYHGCEAKKEEEEDNGFDCPECGKKYWSQKMLDIHKKVSKRFTVNPYFPMFERYRKSMTSN